MSSRNEIAREIIRNGGKFVRKLENNPAIGRSQFRTRLYDVAGKVVKGIGQATLESIQSDLRIMTTWRTSDWPTVYCGINMPITTEELAIMTQRERESWFHQD